MSSALLPLLAGLALAQSAPPAASPAAAPTPAPASSGTAPAATAPAATAPTATAPAPKVPRFSKTPVGSCGCALYAPAGFTFGEPSKSADGADVWIGESTADGWTFGAVVVKFPAPMAGTPDELEALLVSYLEFLRGQFGIVASAGVGRGHTHGENPAARGVIDYWQDGAGDSWAVKGWVDGGRLAVLFVSGKGEYPYFNAQQMYLDGFRFK